MCTVDALAAAAAAAAMLAAVYLCFRALWNHVLYEYTGSSSYQVAPRISQSPQYQNQARISYLVDVTNILAKCSTTLTPSVGTH
jgi:hypothetical protein